MVHKSNSPPDLDKYIKGKLHNFVTYEDGARLYSIPYWSFVNSVKEAGANRMIRQRVLVDQDIYEKFIEDNCRYEETVKENKEMPKRRIVPNLEEMVKKGKKKYVRYQEGAELYSMGLHLSYFASYRSWRSHQTDYFCQGNLSWSCQDIRA